MKLHFLAPLALLTVAPLSVPASAYDWGPNGVPVAGGVFGQDAQRILSDGAGGAFIAWRDNRHPSLTNSDVYLQRITASGQVAPGWPVDGFPVCTNPSQQELAHIAPDGRGGVLLVWVDSRGPGTSLDIYAQRVRADGTLAPGWPVDGAPVSRTVGYQSNPLIEPDGSGGCYVAWDDWTDYGFRPTAFVQHLAPDGVPASGWPTDGMRLSLNTGSVSGVVADGIDGAVIYWGQARDGTADAYAVKVTPSGEIAPGWPTGGAPIALGCGTRGAVPDGAGGFYAVCAIVLGGVEREYEIHRWTFDGTRVPGWPEEGLRAGVAPGSRPGPFVKSDGLGGLLLGWWDYRNPSGGSDVYATRVLPNSTFAPGWPQDGVLASDATQDLETNVDIAPDGSGGAYVVWQWDTFTGSPSKIQHLSADGHIAAGWPENGVVVSQQSSQFDPVVAFDGQGGAIVVWDYTSLFAQHFSMEAPVPALPSLVSAEVTADAVILSWIAPSAGDWKASVFRRTTQSEWQLLGSPVIDGPEGLHYEDHSVVAGARYAYRLGLREGDEEIFTAETWVNVPSELTLQLQGFAPNPAVGTRFVSFTLPTAAPAALELFNVAGRRVLVREVGSFGPGRHVINLSERTDLAAGVYWMRLNQEGRFLTARGVIIR